MASFHAMNSSQFREAAHSVIEEIIQYYETIESRRVLSAVKPGYLAPLLPTSAPDNGEPWSAIQPDIERLIMPGITHWQSPNFMAFYPASSTYPGMLGELYSAAINVPAFNWLNSPAITELETVVLDWLAKALALPEGFLSKGQGGGVMHGSASEAIATTMVAARERVTQRMCGTDESIETEDKVATLRGRLVALGSEQAHSATQKGARIAGTRYRSVPANIGTDFAITGKELRGVLEKCTENGLIPYYLTVTMGTTATCSSDRFDEIVEVLKDYPDVWAHVDAAHAGSALVLPEYQYISKKFAAFQSFNLNMHKWLLVNWDASCVFVQKRSDLTSALSVTRSYLRTDEAEAGLVTDYRDWQIPLGRRFRSLKIWFVLRTYGISGLQSHIRYHLKLGEIFSDLVRKRSDIFRVFTGPIFGLTVFSIVGKKKFHQSIDQEAEGSAPETQPGPQLEAHLNNATSESESLTLTDANAVTKEVYERICSRGEIFLTSAVIEGIYVIRFIAAVPLSEERHVYLGYNIIEKTALEVLQEK